MWIITKFCGSTPVRRPLCSKPRRKFVQTSYALKSQSLATFLSLSAKAHVHPVTNAQLRNPQHTYVKCPVGKAHFKLNRAFKVIRGHPYWCQQKSRTVCCRNMLLMPTLFLKLLKIARENCKFVDFNDLTPVWRRSCKKRPRISANGLYCQNLELLTYIFATESMFVSFHAIIFESRTLWVKNFRYETRVWREIAT